MILWNYQIIKKLPPVNLTDESFIMIQLLPSEESILGTQKCSLGPKFMNEHGLYLGTFLKIRCNGKFVICQAWPRADLDENFVQYDDMVIRENNDSVPYINQLSIQDIECLGYGTSLNELSVHVVLSDLKQVKKFKGSVCERANLSRYIKNILKNIGVVKDSRIHCASLNLGKLYKVASITVKDIACEATVGVVKSNTVIIIESVMSLERYEQKRDSRKLTLGGLNQPFEMLKEIIQLPFHHEDKLQHLGISCPVGVLLQGPPGCGKTSLVKQTAIDCDAHLLVVNSPDIFGSRPGESEENLRQKFQTASDMCEEGPCILFIDEIDTLCPKQGKGGGNAESRLVAQLGGLMDTVSDVKGLVVVAATNRPNHLDPSLRRPGRFDREIFIGIPSTDERYDILTAQTSRMNLSQDVSLYSLAEATKGYVGADLVSVCQEVSYQALRRTLHHDQEDIPLTMDNFLSAIGKICPSTQRGSDILVDYKPVRWDDIGGLDEVKVKIQQAVEWPIKHPEAFQRLGLPCPKGVLLYGPPGCCKTTLVKAAATACKATFLSVSGAQLFSPFVGDSERKIAEVFQQARAGAPSILFFDEIDSIVGKRSEGSSGRGVQERVLSTLLNHMDGIGIRLDEQTRGSDVRVLEGATCTSKEKGHVVINNNDVLVVAATNRPDMLDDALLRPGRIDRIVYVPAPDEKTRLRILEIHTRKMPTEGLDLVDIAQRTDMFTGADLENLCRETALRALTQDGLETATVKHHHFLETLDVLNPTLTEELLKKYKEIKLKSSK
ncbi:ATPase family gene 2 protein homolog B-like [Lineus longissimus]|uniref:ATPase family gene 2 protein homolog B-like n=1 Tax=Lineus longissimus TaxID=88925 RepID=UPI00315D4E0A